MPRAFTDADIVQPNTGSSTTSSITATLPAGTTEGNAGIVVIGGSNILDPPEQWHSAASAGGTGEKLPQLLIGCRANLLAGESSWSFPLANGLTANVLWTIAEWRNVSFCPVVAKAFQPTSVSASSVSLSASQQGDLTPAYTMAIAALAILGSGTATSPWSAVTWSGGFTETDVLTLGTGQVNDDVQLRVARRYGAANETGPWATTATFTGGAQTNKVVYGALAVFRAENYVGEA